jgi:hypothetical protein
MREFNVHESVSLLNESVEKESWSGSPSMYKNALTRLHVPNDISGT